MKRLLAVRGSTAALMSLVLVGFVLAFLACPLVFGHFNIPEIIPVRGCLWFLIIFGVAFAALGFRSEKRRFKVYAIFSLCIWFWIFWMMLLSSDTSREHIPTGVKVEGLTRYEAEFFYARIHGAMRGLYWQGFGKDEFGDSWKRIRDWRYSIESLKKNDDGSVSAMVAHKWRGKPTMKMDHRITGGWPGKTSTTNLLHKAQP